MPLSHQLLCLSMVLTLLPLRWPWLVALIAAVSAGIMQGQLTLVALVPITALLALCWRTLATHRRPRRDTGLLLLMLVLGLALALHQLPGFLNPTYLVSMSDQHPPTLKYLNFDKGVAGLLLLVVLVGARRAEMRDRHGGFSATLFMTKASGPPASSGSGRLVLVAAATLALPWLGAVATGLGTPALRWPENAGLFLASNLFLTCVAEEVAFRGVIQQLLGRVFGDKQRRWQGWRSGVPVLLAALVFGLAHAGGGAAYAALATLAGLGYGLMYRLSGRIELAILLHFALNALVFVTLSLPQA